MPVANGNIVVISSPASLIASKFTGTFKLDNGQEVTYTANLSISDAGPTTARATAKLTYAKVSDLEGDRRYNTILGKGMPLILNIDPAGTTITSAITVNREHAQSVSGIGKWSTS